MARAVRGDHRRATARQSDRDPGGTGNPPGQRAPVRVLYVDPARDGVVRGQRDARLAVHPYPARGTAGAIRVHEEGALDAQRRDRRVRQPVRVGGEGAVHGS
ncbi:MULTISPECIES: hypothetical protein [unclassified Streptomyces]|uniref:hypothetical protein n=1 Tax=unclassified Streptomyces TaxID=2593676 RepID=UPI002254C023|nr:MULTISPECIES: hypothetical protein [unclassified Streptomyces]MCX4786122.1 hypothetical protein [Streptomyces sp. NBC_01221]MCX4798021.1 hypothetical protein [Streptomyces sp. NBC_01242]WSP65577.1 hypothetical protein OG466_29565 [Streptomyces sp. NBC_01240]WSU24751.1 hypothetical protein OG508_29910 [Streptomyces sp. NBC_01108]